MEPKDGSWEMKIKWLMWSFTVKGEGEPPTPIDSANKHLSKEKIVLAMQRKHQLKCRRPPSSQTVALSSTPQQCCDLHDTGG